MLALTLVNAFPAQSILLGAGSLLLHRPARIKNMGRVTRRWRVRRIRLLQQRRVQTHVVHTLIRADECQIVGAGRDVRGPLIVRAGREVDSIHDVDQNKAQDEPQDTRNGAARAEQDVADVQVQQSEDDPVQGLHELECILAQRHSLRSGPVFGRNRSEKLQCIRQRVVVAIDERIRLRIGLVVTHRCTEVGDSLRKQTVQGLGTR